MTQKPVDEKIQANVKNVVEEAKQEVATARRPWYHAIRWGFILLGIYAVQHSSLYSPYHTDGCDLLDSSSTSRSNYDRGSFCGECCFE